MIIFKTSLIKCCILVSVINYLSIYSYRYIDLQNNVITHSKSFLADQQILCIVFVREY